MQFWFARGGGVPIRDQLVTQIMLGILCGELAAGRRLPSTREIARRFRIHPNTVSAAYRKLEEGHWVESRRGSGVYVSRKQPETNESSALDRLIAQLFRSAREIGIVPAEVRLRLQQWMAVQAPDHFLVIESDEELRRIIMAEIGHVTAFPVKGIGPQDCRPEMLAGAVVLSLPAASVAVRSMLPPGIEHMELRLRSATASLAPWLPVRRDALVAVASRCMKFLTTTQTMLLAAGFREEALMVRDARRRDWHKGLSQSSAVVCDFATSLGLPKACRPIVFLLISDASIEELQQVAAMATSAAV